MEKNTTTGMTQGVKNAVDTIKTAILQSQSRAVRLISGSQLSLYFGVGLYVSANSREGTWGTGAIDDISEQLQRELPGLRGFSAQNIRNMRLFAEFWERYLICSPRRVNWKTQKCVSLLSMITFHLQNGRRCAK